MTKRIIGILMLLLPLGVAGWFWWPLGRLMLSLGAGFAVLAYLAYAISLIYRGGEKGK
jgi:hypothetical protein